MLVAVIADGNKPSVERIKQKGYDKLICVDGACGWAMSNGFLPDMAVGDMDSVNEAALTALANTGVAIQRHPTVKDETDSLLAIDSAVALGADEIILYGATGGRIDHTLANIALLLRYARKGIRIKIIDEYVTAFAASGKVRLSSEPGKALSILPLDGSCHIKRLEGLLYPIDDAEITAEYPYSVSNEFIAENAVIQIERGWALIVQPH